MDRSATGVRGSVSLALVLLVSGSVTPAGGSTRAVLVRVPAAEGSMSTVKVKVTLAPTGRLMVAARAPVPLVGPVTVPVLAFGTNAQVAAVAPAGRGSDT